MSHKLRTEKQCLNCDHQVELRYCSACGQENSIPRESFRHIMSHFITDYLHIDHKLFSAILPLLFKPGFLTSEYNAGKRARYVHPFRLYIFIRIFYFLLAGLIHHNTSMLTTSTAPHTSPNAEAAANFAANAANISSAVQDSIHTHYSDLATYRKQQTTLGETERDNFMSRFFIKRVQSATENGYNIGEKVSESLTKNAPKIVFLMLPMFALLLKITFRRKALFYVEHFFHSVYIHSFVFLLLSIQLLLKQTVPNSISTYFDMLSFLIPVYIYVSCRHVYSEKATATCVKMLVMAVGYGTVLLCLTTFNVLISIATL